MVRQSGSFEDLRLGVLTCDYPNVGLSNVNIWQYLYPRIKKWGDLSAYVIAETEESLTYKELLGKSLRWAYELKKHFKGSVPPTVSFVMKNNIDYFPLFLGCYAVGTAVCPINAEITNELFEIMMIQLKADIIVLDSKSFEIYGGIIDRLKIKPCIYIRGNLSKIGIKDLHKILNSGIKLQETEAGKFELTTTACKVFLSGTTGSPKCIVISHGSLTNTIMSFSQKEFNPLPAADEAGQATIIGYLPLAHLFEFEYFTIFAPSLGCKTIYMENEYCSTLKLISATAKYEPELIRLRYYSVDELSMTKNVDAIKSLKTILFTGSPPNVNSFNKLNEIFERKLFFQNLYGTSEANIISSMPLTDVRPEMSGKLISNCQARLVDSLTEQNITEPHKIGDVYIKSPFIMDCYQNNPEATKEALDSDGWFYTGDVGYFDEDHFLDIIDRKNNIITVCLGNERKLVSPAKLESVIKLHEGVTDAGVIGVPDIETGEEILKAFVVCKNPVDEQELIKFVGNKVPEEMMLTGGIEFVKELPRNAMGKLMRRYLREKVWYR